MNLTDIVNGPASLPPRIVLLGREKVGKSTFASQAPNPIFLPIRGEEGIDALSVARFPTLQSFTDLVEALRLLAKEEHDYETVVIDSVSALEPLVWQQACQQHGWRSVESPGYGKGYIEALTYWRQVTEALDWLRRERGMTVILIGHTKIKVINDPLLDPFDAYIFDVHDRAAQLLYRWSDSILFATRKAFTKKADAGFGKQITHAVGTDERVLRTRARPGHPGGGRGVYGQLPQELPLSWAAFEAAINQNEKGSSQ